MVTARHKGADYYSMPKRGLEISSVSYNRGKNVTAFFGLASLFYPPSPDVVHINTLFLSPPMLL